MSIDVFFRLRGVHRDLHSFPTRRSSELDRHGVVQAIARAECHALSRRVMLARSEEHTSELQSHSDLVCRPLLEKKKVKNTCFKGAGEIFTSSLASANPAACPIWKGGAYSIVSSWLATAWTISRRP